MIRKQETEIRRGDVEEAAQLVNLKDITIPKI